MQKSETWAALPALSVQLTFRDWYCRRPFYIFFHPLLTPTIPAVANCLHYRFEEGHLAFPSRLGTAGLLLISWTSSSVLVSDSACLLSQSNGVGGWKKILSVETLEWGFLKRPLRNRRDGQSCAHIINHVSTVLTIGSYFPIAESDALWRHSSWKKSFRLLLCRDHLQNSLPCICWLSNP